MAETTNKGFVYLTIPYDYLCIYERLLTYMADVGEDALKNCDTTCKGVNKNIIKCWNIFQSALAAKASGKDKLAEVLIKYVDAELDNIYKGTDKKFEYKESVEDVDENGYVHGQFVCLNGFDFFIPTVDGENGATCDGKPVKAWNLYLYYWGSKSETKEFDLITDTNKDLIVHSDTQI